MFASPSFESSPPQPGGGSGSGSGGSPPTDNNDNDRGDASPVIFSSGDDGVEEEEEDDDEEEVEVEEEEREDEDGEDEEEEEEEEDDEELDEEDDDDAVSPDASVTPASTGTTRNATTPATGQMPPPPANNLGVNSTHLTIRAVPEIKLGAQFREIGKEALCWQLSSAKPGNGVEQIRDGSTDTYWQSDGLKQPHWIQVHFARRVALSHVCLYLDYSLDESYTPKRVSVHHGMTSQDLQSAMYPAHTEIEFAEPNGWCIIPLNAPPDPLDIYHENATTTMPQSATSNNTCIRAHLLRISILAMHQNGRDTHIRQVELYGPRRPNVAPALRPAVAAEEQDENEDPSFMDEDTTLPQWSSSFLGGGVVR